MADSEPQAEQQFGRRARRVAVSDKSYNPNEQPKMAKVPKSKQDAKKINDRLGENFLFSHLTEEGRADLVDVIVEKKFATGDVVIKQGDDGDFFYIIDSGNCEIFVNDVKVMSCKDGDSFGELALMYGAPRAATVKAVSKMKCWAVDRDTFKYTLMNHTIKKRDLYEAFLREVPLLESLLDYERLTIADALQPEKFTNGDFVIKQGDTGDNLKFYILEKGEVKIVKDGDEMGVIEAGGYFGELALLTDEARAASIIVNSPDATVLAIDKKTFTGVMGPTHLLLKRKANQYSKYLNKDFKNLVEAEGAIPTTEGDDDE